MSDETVHIPSLQVSATHHSTTIMTLPGDSVLSYHFSVGIGRAGTYDLTKALHDKILPLIKKQYSNAKDFDFDILEDSLKMRGYRLSGNVTSSSDNATTEHFEHSSLLTYPFLNSVITAGERKGQYDLLAAAHPAQSNPRCSDMHDVTEISAIYRHDTKLLYVCSDFLNRFRDEYTNLLAMDGQKRRVETYLMTEIVGKVVIRGISFPLDGLDKNPEANRLAQAMRLLQEVKTIMECNDPRQAVLQRIGKFLDPQ
jgi:hypothetical protein